MASIGKMLPLLFLVACANTPSMEKRLAKLNVNSAAEREACKKFENEVVRTKAIKRKKDDIGLRDKKSALQALALIEQSGRGLSPQTIEAYRLLLQEKNWSESQSFLEEFSRLNGECALFEKYDLFTAFAADHERVKFAPEEKLMFLTQFRRFTDEGLDVPTSTIAVMVRIKNLRQLSEAGLIGAPADKQEIQVLDQDAERDLEAIKLKLKNEKASVFTLREEMLLSRRFAEKLEAIYRRM